MKYPPHYQALNALGCPPSALGCPPSALGCPISPLGDFVINWPATNGVMHSTSLFSSDYQNAFTDRAAQGLITLLQQNRAVVKADGSVRSNPATTGQDEELAPPGSIVMSAWQFLTAPVSATQAQTASVTASATTVPAWIMPTFANTRTANSLQSLILGVSSGIYAVYADGSIRQPASGLILAPAGSVNTTFYSQATGQPAQPIPGAAGITQPTNLLSSLIGAAGAVALQQASVAPTPAPPPPPPPPALNLGVGASAPALAAPPPPPPPPPQITLTPNYTQPGAATNLTGTSVAAPAPAAGGGLSAGDLLSIITATTGRAAPAPEVPAAVPPVSGTPSWLMPVAVIGGLGLVALLVTSRATRVRRNPAARRFHRYHRQRRR